MQSSLQTVRVRRISPGQLLRRARDDWRTTPGKLLVAGIVLVLGVLLTGGFGVWAAVARVNTTRDILEHREPLTANVTTLYRSLADADATVAAGYLSGGVEPSDIQIQYRDDIARAARNLARAGTQAGRAGVTAQGIVSITAQLPVYTGLVERARANNLQGFAVGVAYLRRASQLMRNSILPEAAELQHRQATRLEDASRQAGSVPVVALALCGASLVGLIVVQVFLYRWTHRLCNTGLFVATMAVLAGLGWWAVAGVVSSHSLASALGHSRSVSEGLTPAQVAALRARAFESLQLVDRNGALFEPGFTDQMRQLTQDNGTGGTLGNAARFATDPTSKALVQAAVRDALGYATAHQEVRRLDDAGNYIQAVHAVVQPQGDAAVAFHRLNAVLTTAIDDQGRAFTKDIERAQSQLTDLPVGTGALALAAALGVALGGWQRLKEYR